MLPIPGLADWPIAMGQRDAFLAWAAGFFDGEGCIRINVQHFPRMRNPSASLSMGITNTVAAPLLMLNTAYRGCYRTYRHHNPKHAKYAKWTISGQTAYRFAKDILPFARVKHDQIALGIAFYELPWRSPGQGHHRPRTPEQVQVDLEYASRISLAKRMPLGAVRT